jgi:DUF917 family protein
MFNVTRDDVEPIARGAAVLGAGGGGNAYLATVALTHALGAEGRVEVLEVGELGDDDLGCAVSGMGAPTVGIERLDAEGEMAGAVRALERYVGRPFRYVVIGEIGGGNAIAPLLCAWDLKLAVVDADPMGRAFPELQMDTFMIGGVDPSPLGLYDGKGGGAVLTVPDPVTAERYARALTWAMGGSAALALPVLTGAQVKRLAIPGTLSLARRMGRALMEAERGHVDPVDALNGVVTTVRLFTGKVTDLLRRTEAGFARGELVLEGIGSHRGEVLRIAFQNEFLVARRDGEAEPLATVPDIISLLDLETGQAVSTELLRYGLRLTVIALPAPRELRTPEALAVIGPAAFGYPDPYRPLEGELLGRS